MENKEQFKDYLKIAGMRIIGILLPVLIMFIYLVVNGAIKDFVNYAILGISTFSNKIKYVKLFSNDKIEIRILSVLMPVSIIIMLMILIIANILKKENKNLINLLTILVYSLSIIIVMYPISDEIHFLIGGLIAIIGLIYVTFLLCKIIYDKIKINKKDSFQTYYALNELRLDQGLQAQVIHVYIGNVLLEVFRGNGLCVSTPSGSTAYNKSLGGSIIYPGIPLMQLTEVAGIHHNAYRSLGSSLILDESQTIKLVGNHFNHSLIGIDHIHLELEDVESIEITIGRKYVRFIEYKEMSFIKRVRRAFINS